MHCRAHKLYSPARQIGSHFILQFASNFLVLVKSPFTWFSLQLGKRTFSLSRVIHNVRIRLIMDTFRSSPFFSFIVECVFWFWVGRSVGKKNAKTKFENCLELGGPVPHHHIRGAWKQQGMVTKSTWRQWRKEKSTSLLESNENREKAKTL